MDVQRLKKRKKGLEGQPNGRKRKKVEVPQDHDANSINSKIEEFEIQILKSQKNYNQINQLLDYAKNENSKGSQEKARLALCNIFLYFITEKILFPERRSATQDDVIGRWLVKRYQLYCDILLESLAYDDQLSSRILIKLVIEEVSSASSNQIWTDGLFARIMQTILDQDGIELTTDNFIVEQVLLHKDTRMYACRIISATQRMTGETIDHTITLLSQIPQPRKDDEDANTCLARPNDQSKRKVPSDAVYKKAAEDAWLAVLRSRLTDSQRKRLLDLMSNTIAPWFKKPEMLSDFLTDCFNASGALSLAALSGIFYLIQHRNLDYPQFYTKVYSLIDQKILHSKQRSRFLRLVNIFLASTHLPAALVASFMKRLSRLCLHAPPSAIIAIVPWIYNMIQEHPVTAFMIHRDDHSGHDVFDLDEPDPMQTKALESSLWEIETLFRHYHPNVATIASIIGKPFTKQSYKLEDFLDYTYDGMLEAELGKTLKRAPIVEFQIPKRIFTMAEEGEQREDELLTKIFDFST